ncbi:conserved hypothetical protein [Beutenbergia cavernae DSM 12333]|uniref:Peptidase n=1 Tax=Beutenbergia cavernae (strain ATCC BAA-8 / DSM 12333 / CCUG 43141 / JCM 11478 / NBRC 16432 / NCIMB 13614 / HKI 0122) TaxID=471853 RepID=C5C1Q1_BEUC1|nr:hypothetical protein [Beutenbergia cavernae]ACQ79519.1 conserved hypothetical protein [Beutenbergia cavernae DSM 12333]
MDPRGPVEVVALRAGHELAGFVLGNRWPDSTDEWAEFLLLAVRFAAVPGMLEHSTVFRVREELPEEPQPGTVGLVLAEGHVVGEHALAPAQFSPPPPGLVVLHPPNEPPTRAAADRDVASGCVLLPGLPHLGLDHRAAWARSDRTGGVTETRTRTAVDPARDVDTAVLALLIAA